MKYSCSALAVFLFVFSAAVFADITYYAPGAQELLMAQSTSKPVNLSAQPTQTQINSVNATGEKQSAIVDQNGSLRMVERQAAAEHSTEAETDQSQTMPKQNAPVPAGQAAPQPDAGQANQMQPGQMPPEQGSQQQPGQPPQPGQFGPGQGPQPTGPMPPNYTPPPPPPIQMQPGAQQPTQPNQMQQGMQQPAQQGQAPQGMMVPQQMPTGSGQMQPAQMQSAQMQPAQMQPTR